MVSRNFNSFVSHEKVSCRVYLRMNTKQGGADSPWPGWLNIPGRCCSEPGAWGGGASRQRAMSSSVAWQPMSDTCNTVDNANVDLWTCGANDVLSYEWDRVNPSFANRHQAAASQLSTPDRRRGLKLDCCLYIEIDAGTAARRNTDWRISRLSQT